MASKRMTTPTKAANIATSVIISIIVVLMGLLMLLSGLEVITIDIGVFWLPTLLFAVCLVCLTLGILRRETLPLWLGIIAGVCGFCVLAHLTSGVAYDKLYPMFIVSPAVASLITLFFADNKKLHLQSIILFVGLAFIFLLQSMGWIKNWWIIAGILVIMLGLFFFISAVTARRGRWDDGDRPQREHGKKWDDGDRPQETKQDDNQQ